MEHHTTAKFLSGMLKSLPPFEDVFKMAGMELPNFLKGVMNEELKKDNQVAAEEIKEVEEVKKA